jgi:lipoate-protein ligase A
MIFILNNNSKSIYFNLALIEAIIKDKTIKEEFFWFWSVNKAIVFGFNQKNPYFYFDQETLDYFYQVKKIEIARRLTGGDILFLDKNVLNFSWIKKKRRENYQINQDLDLKQIIEAVNQYLKIKLNYVKIDDYISEYWDQNKKIIKIYQFHYQDRIFLHGIILINYQKEKWRKLLFIDQKEKGNKKEFLKIIFNELKTWRNIKKYFNQEKEITSFKNTIIFSLIKKELIIKNISQKIKEEISFLIKTKYKTINWNYDNGLIRKNFFTFILKEKILIFLSISLEKKIIKDIKFVGNYSSYKGSKLIEKKMLNQYLNQKKIKEIFLNDEIKKQMNSNIDKNELINQFKKKIK